MLDDLLPVRHPVARALPRRLPRPRGEPPEPRAGPRDPASTRASTPVGFAAPARALECRARRGARGPRLPLLVRLPARLRRPPVLPLARRPVLARPPGADPPDLRGPLPRGRGRRRPGDRRPPGRGSSGRRSRRASRRSSTATPSAGSAGSPRSSPRWPTAVAGEPLLWRVDPDRVRPLVALAGRAAVVGRRRGRGPVRGPVRGLGRRLPARPGGRPRAGTSSTIPLDGPGTPLRLDDLAYERREARGRPARARPVAAAAEPAGRRSARRSTGRPSRRSTSCPSDTLSDRVKKGLRWWRAGGREMIGTAMSDRRPRRPPATATAARLGWLAARSRGPMAPGSVLFHAPSHVFQAPGRGREPARADGPAPRRPRASRSGRSRPGPTGSRTARLLHLFGMSREGLELARVARARGVPVVLSPICWYRAAGHRRAGARAGRGGLGPGEVGRARSAAPRWPSWRRELLGPGRRDPAQLARPRRGSSSGSSGPTRADPRRAQRRRARLADASPRLFRERFGPGRSCCLPAGSAIRNLSKVSRQQGYVLLQNYAGEGIRRS